MAQGGIAQRVLPPHGDQTLNKCGKNSVWFCLILMFDQLLLTWRLAEIGTRENVPVSDPTNSGDQDRVLWRLKPASEKTKSSDHKNWLGMLWHTSCERFSVNTVRVRSLLTGVLTCIDQGNKRRTIYFIVKNTLYVYCISSRDCRVSIIFLRSYAGPKKLGPFKFKRLKPCKQTPHVPMWLINSFGSAWRFERT